MKLKKAFIAAAIGLSLMSAQATTITNTGGTFDWTGFDWSANGTAYTTGFVPAAGDLFSITAFAAAVTLKNGPEDILGLKLDSNANGAPPPGTGWYEYTLRVLLNEKVNSCSADLTTCTFSVTSGSYDIFYDTTPDADARAGSLGTGFLNGAKILSGSISAQPGGTFTVAGAGGTGVASLLGTNTFTDSFFINPDVTSTTATTTLQIGNKFSNLYVSPGGFDNVAFAPGTLVFQADANQSFSTVPEPASLALFGIAMLAGGAASRRRIKK